MNTDATTVVLTPDLAKLRTTVGDALKAYITVHTAYHALCKTQIVEGPRSRVSDADIDAAHQALVAPASAVVAAVNALLPHLRVTSTDEIEQLTIVRDRAMRHIVGPIADN
jgi:hypothetical protein